MLLIVLLKSRFYCKAESTKQQESLDLYDGSFKWARMERARKTAKEPKRDFSHTAVVKK